MIAAGHGVNLGSTPEFAGHENNRLEGTAKFRGSVRFGILISGDTLLRQTTAKGGKLGDVVKIRGGVVFLTRQ